MSQSQARSLEQPSSLHLIDCEGVSFCQFCEQVVVFRPDFTAKHRLFKIDTNEDLAEYLKLAREAFASVTEHPHWNLLIEATSRPVTGPLEFKADLGTHLEAFSHLAIDLSLNPCEPNSCHLTHLKFNKHPWLNLTLNLENCSSCLYKKDNNIGDNVQDYNEKYIPSWRPREAAEQPPCSSEFRLQLDRNWRKPFTPRCHCCKLRRLRRSSYCVGLAELWTKFYTTPFCVCPFGCFGRL